MGLLHTTGLRPPVSPAPDAAEFWNAASGHRLVLPSCRSCEAPFFYPRTLCPRCGGRDLEWITASGRGTLHSFCLQYHSDVPGLGESSAFGTALVDLAEGPRIMTFLVGVSDDPEQISCGVPGAVEFLDIDGGQTVLQFRPS